MVSLDLEEIENFISKCKNSENNQGYLTKNIFNLYKDREYKFFQGHLQT